MRARAPIILTIALMLISASAARADTYCVGKTGCDHDVAGNDLQLALTQAAGHSGEDTVEVGQAQFLAASGFTYSSSDAVHIVGDGGVVTNGTLDDVLVEGQEKASLLATGVQLDDGGSLVNSRVLMEPTASSTGVVFNGAGTRASDSRIEATEGLATGSAGVPSGSAARVSVGWSEEGASVGRGTLNIEDSTFESRTDTTTSPRAFVVNASAADAGLTANHVTILGSTDPTGLALESVASSGHSSSLVLRNSVITQYPNAFRRSASGGGQANITTDYSDYGGATALDSGLGSITETHHMNASPGFLTATDPHLRADSPLVDAGDPAGLTSVESTTDASGQPRIVDGDGNCSARRDIGAYEFQPGPRAPRANASAAPVAAFTGQLVTFNSPDACDPDGDPLSFSWTFDDGGGAPGASVQRTFSTPGIHFGTVTVTDNTGRSATATASVFIAYPPFAGVAIGHGKVRASRKGAVKLSMSCPATTVGRCAGTLTLDGARASFSMPAGASKPVTVKLSKSKLKTLRKKRRQTFTAVAVAHDANGTARTSTARLTLLAPR